jgi:hypothetical protein
VTTSVADGADTCSVQTTIGRAPPTRNRSTALNITTEDVGDLIDKICVVHRR